VHFEHKKLLLHRLRLLSPAVGEDPPARSYERLVTEVDRARLRVLMSERQGKPLPHDLVERFEGFRAAETEILTAWLQQLHCRRSARSHRLVDVQRLVNHRGLAEPLDHGLAGRRAQARRQAGVEQQPEQRLAQPLRVLGRR